MALNDLPPPATEKLFEERATSEGLEKLQKFISDKPFARNFASSKRKAFGFGGNNRIKFKL
jgi:hypothetical protein